MPSPLNFLLGGGGQPTNGDPNTFDPNNPLLRGLLMAAQQQPQDAQAPAVAPPSSFGLLGPIGPQGTGLLAMRGDAAPIEGRSASTATPLNLNGFQADNPSDVEDPVKRSDGSYKLDTDPAGHTWAQQNAAKYGLTPDPSDPTVYRPLATAAAAPQGAQPNATPPMMTMASPPMSLSGAPASAPAGSPASAPVDMTRGAPGASTPAPAAANGPVQRAPDSTGANVIGTPASGTTEASSPLGGFGDFMGKAANVVGGLYGAGGPGDALIALGLSKMTDGASVQVLNSMNSARAQQAQQALLNLQMNQKLLSYAGNVQAVKQAFPGMSDAQAAAYAGSDTAMADVRKRLNPPRPNYGDPVTKDGVTWQQNKDTGEWVKKDEDGYQLVDVAIGQNPDGTTRYQQQWLKKGEAPGTGAPGTDGGPTVVGAPFTKQATTVLTQESAKSRKIGEGKGSVVDDAIKAGAVAPRKLQALNTIQDAFDSSGGKINTGPFAGKILAGKQVIKDAFGIDPGALPQTEVASKTGFALATEAARAISQRGGTQAEFLKGLQNVPGLFLSPEGNRAMVAILRQQAQQEQQLGIMAYDHKPGENWLAKERDFYDNNPIISPFTGKPMNSSDVEFLKSKADPDSSPTTPPPTSTLSPQAPRKTPSWSYGQQ